MSPQISRAGEWFLHSGIQEPNGGVARYYRADTCRNLPISTEITGYAASAFVYLHSVTGDDRYLERAGAAARFLARCAWDAGRRVMPFELTEPRYSYFFDCGIIVRGLLSAWRATGEQEFLDVAAETGSAMARDFAAGESFHPVLALPHRRPEPRDAARWSRSPGCYQLKSAMAWWDLSEATGEASFRSHYNQVLEYSLRTYQEFLPGHPDRRKVMDRLHAFLYFLEGLLPAAGNPAFATAIGDGIEQAGALLRDIAPEFARSDVYAQLLRTRLFADWLGAVPLDTAAAAQEATALVSFQAADADLRIGGGYYFGEAAGERLPFVNPVSTAFAMQALEMWNNRENRPLRHLLI